jgi:putative endonuclease
MFVYILTNKTNSVLYIGVTNDIKRRVTKHKSGEVDGFTKRYNVTKPVYCEEHKDPEVAIKREKQLKGWTKDKKIRLIESQNPTWDDISIKITTI